MHVQHLPRSSLERGWRRVLAHVSVTSKPTALHKAVLLAPGLRDAPILNLQMSASGVGHPKTIGDVCRSACISCPWHRCSCLLVTLAFKRESQASPLLPPKKSCFYIHDEQRSLQKCSPKSCFRENYAGLEEKFPLARPGGESSKGASAASAVGGAAAARAIGPTGVPSPAEGAAFPPPPPFMPAVPGGGTCTPKPEQEHSLCSSPGSRWANGKLRSLSFDGARGTYFPLNDERGSGSGWILGEISCISAFPRPHQAARGHPGSDSSTGKFGGQLPAPTALSQMHYIQGRRLHLLCQEETSGAPRSIEKQPRWAKVCLNAPSGCFTMPYSPFLPLKAGPNLQQTPLKSWDAFFVFQTLGSKYGLVADSYTSISKTRLINCSTWAVWC